MNLDWVWEGRGEAEFQTPEVSSIYEGWKPWPGDMASSVSVHAEIFAREITQNFVDASREQSGVSGTGIPKLTFEFVDFSGDEASNLRGRMGLKSISDQYANFSEKDLRNLKLPETDFYNSTKKLRLLVVRETGTTGMYGPWARDNRVLDSNGNRIFRKMRDALLSTVGSKSDVGLGSYGEGKRAIIGASKIRTIFTYTAFSKSTNAEGISRRFLGSTYWRAHEVKETAYSGLALLGKQNANEVRPEPIVDAEADEFVKYLNVPGFEVRNASNSAEYGTTQIFVDPDLEPGDLASALERNWWPLLVENKIELEVSEGGSKWEISPEKRPELRHYIEGYLDLKGGQKTHSQTEFFDVSVKNGTLKAGKLALLADTSDGGWSYANLETNRSLVALIRDGMIISYQMLPREKALPAPFVRGVYVVDRESAGIVEEKLRAVEPPLHNYWNTSNSAMERDAVSIAKDVYKILRQQLIDFRSKFLEEQSRKETGLDLFDELLSSSGAKRILGQKPVIDPNPRDDWSILSVEAGIKEASSGYGRTAYATRKVQLRKNAPAQTVKISLGWEVQGDDGAWESEPTLSNTLVTAPEGFTAELNLFEGLLEPGNSYEFSWESTSYNELWTLRPFLKVISGAATENEVNDGN